MRDYLSDAYMARIEFHLEFEEAFSFKQSMLLQLRREFAAVVRLAADTLLADYIDPPVPDDPYARKKFQKPAPPFVIQAAGMRDELIEAGESFVLKVLFFGNLGANVGLFSRLLQLLGQVGLHKGEGRFELDMVIGRDQAGNQQLLWRSGELPAVFTVPQINLLWYLEDRSLSRAKITLTFLTPARLLSDGKPLFNPTFMDIFPFVFRRVTSMLYCWSGFELTEDPQLFISLAAQVAEADNQLRWHDWRQMAAVDQDQELGGLLGSLQIDSVDSERIVNILQLGELLHLGRGAAYGAGAYRLQQCKI